MNESFVVLLAILLSLALTALGYYGLYLILKLAVRSGVREALRPDLLAPPAPRKPVVKNDGH